jgi:hypothetical protein
MMRIMAKAVDLLKAGCPTDLPSTPTGRIEAMRLRLSAMLEAVRTVRAPLAEFYALLNDEQKARFNALPSGEDPRFGISVASSLARELFLPAVVAADRRCG